MGEGAATGQGLERRGSKGPEAAAVLRSRTPNPEWAGFAHLRVSTKNLLFFPFVDE